ncbi:Dicer-like protein 2 [Mortierella sp. AD094]|nr:Dicer-like protein 2 [Mortierella sp. AD094]
MRKSESIKNINRTAKRSGCSYLLRSVLTVCSEKSSVGCWSGLGEAFLKYFYSAHFFASFQDDLEGPLTARAQNEMSLEVLSSCVLSSGLAENICTEPDEDSKYKDTDAVELLRGVIGATVAFGGFDDAIRVARFIGLAVDPSIITVKGFKIAYELNRPVDFTIPFFSQDCNELRVMPNDALNRFERVQAAFGYHFTDQRLMLEAITHGSINKSISYERLEFLGDAVLEFAIADLHHKGDPDMILVDFRNAKSSLLTNDSLGSLCVLLGLHETIFTRDPAIKRNLKQDALKVYGRQDSEENGWADLGLSKILGDVFEALVGAVFVDSGFELRPVQCPRKKN